MIRPRSLAALMAAALICATTTARAASLLYVGVTSGIVTYDTATTTPTPTPFVSSAFLNTGSLALAFDATGNIFVSNNTSIEKFSPTGTDLGVFAAGLSIPLGLAFDASGNLYVAVGGTDTIEKFTPGGVASLFATTGPGVVPFGLAFEASGNL